jgi:uncharacterized membrane protein YgcG
MAMSCKRLIALGSLALPLAACASVDPVSQSIDPGFGEALAWNKAVQTIDPDPTFPADGAIPGGNGQVAAEAAKRYRTDRAKPVETMQTTSGPGGGGGGSSGGGGPPK